MNDPNRLTISSELRRHPPVRRCAEFVATDPDDIQRRQRLKEQDIRDLYGLAVEHAELWPLYRTVRVIQQADTVYASGRAPGLSRPEIRSMVSWRGTLTVETDHGRVDRTIISLYWPVMQLGYEALETAGRTTHRLVVYPLLATLQTAEGSKRLLREIGQEAPVLLQRFSGNPAIQGIAFGGDSKYVVRITHPGGAVLEEQDFPLIDRYAPLVKGLARQRQRRGQVLEPSRFKSPVPRQESPSYYHTEEFAEIMRALYESALEYDESRGVDLSAHLKTRIKHKVGDEFDRRSSEVGGTRMLDSARDVSGGSLDEPSSAEDSTPVVESLAAEPDTLPEFRQLVEEILRQRLTDSSDRQILGLSLAGHNQEEIAGQLGINQATVSRRLKRLLKPAK